MAQKQQKGISNRRKEKFSLKKWAEKHPKQFNRIRKCIFAVLMFGVLLYFILKFFITNYKNLDYLTKLNETTYQISNLVDNIRTYYTVYSDDSDFSLEKMIAVDAVPRSIIADDGISLVNLYGGKIIIAPSTKLLNERNNSKSATFKLSYQGLSKDVCVDLAMLDWGNEEKGLLAVAIGSVDENTGTDSAFTDVDYKVESHNSAKRISHNNNRKRFNNRKRANYLLTVVKPNDPFMPAPFTRGSAETGCKCDNKNNCSFALLYTIFNVDQKKTFKK